MVVVLETTTTYNAQRMELHTLGGRYFFITILMNMQQIKNENGLPVNNSSGQSALVHETDKVNSGEMSLKQLNEYLVSSSREICELARKSRTGGHTSDILPPICYINNTLYENISNVLACFSNTLAAALFSESQYIKIHKDFEALSSIVETEKYLIFDFLSENDLTEKFIEFVNNEKQTDEAKKSNTLTTFNMHNN